MRLDTHTVWTDILRAGLVVLEGVYVSCALPNKQASTAEKTAALYRFVSGCRTHRISHELARRKGSKIIAL